MQSVKNVARPGIIVTVATPKMVNKAMLLLRLAVELGRDIQSVYLGFQRKDHKQFLRTIEQ